MVRAYILLLVICCFGCGREKVEPAASTQAMVDYLQAKADTAYLSGSYPYFTDQMLLKLQRNVQGVPPRMRASRLLDYVLVLVLKGENGKCIQLIQEHLESLNNESEINRANQDFYKVMALAFMRQAEQGNCIDNHTSQSCIIPLAGKGIHANKRPSENAKDLYERLLVYDSTDYQSLWFYNIAHMAAGTYPDGVNPAFLIAPDLFESDIDFPIFENIAPELGIDLNNHAGGSSLEDFNNDGFLDIFTTGYSLADPAHLFLNDGQGGFKDYTYEAGITDLTGGLNQIHADFNNDGWTDIFIMRGAWLSSNGHIPNSLLINKGDAKFEDKTEASGLMSFKPTGTVSTADIDLDGDLDIFVGNESTKDRNASELFINQGDGTFMDVAGKLGMQLFTFVKGTVWGDVNNDGLPDLYVSNYNVPNQLFINRGGTSMEDWKFEEVGQRAGVEEPDYSFTTWFWDYDQDGWQDILVFGYDNRKAYAISDEIAKEMLGKETSGEYPRLYKNNRDETFTDVTEEQNLQKLLYSMGGNFGDLDNDGYPDFYAATGEFNIWAAIPNKMFRNNEGLSFQDVTTAGGFGQIQKGHGVAFGDVDNDGDQDVYHQVGGAVESDVFHNMLFENPGFDNQWIKLKLEGTKSNRSAIGAKIEIQVETEEGLKTYYHWVNTGGSFGANSLMAEIGLGKALSINHIKITWPNRDRAEQIFEQVDLNETYRVVEGERVMEKMEMQQVQF